MIWIHLPLNPEPWAIGPVGYARRGGNMSAYVGRNQQLDAYKQAVKELIGNWLVDHPDIADQFPIEGKVELKFFFWRNRADYKTPQEQTARKHEADGTNMAKATEDALQDLLLKNDKDVSKMTWTVVEQGPEVESCIVIGIKPFIYAALPEAVVELLDTAQQELPFDDDEAHWQPPAEGEVF